MKTDLQTRLIKTSNIEIREKEESNEKIIEGILPYNSPSERMFLGYTDAQREVILPSAWNKTISDKRNIFLNYNHDNSLILASTKAGTMEVRSLEDGLHFTASLPDTDIGNRAYQTIKRGDVKTLSFEFYPVDYETRDNISYIKSGRLEAVSCCVSTPAYTSTDCEARELKESISEIKKTIKEKELSEMDNETINELKELLKALLNKLPSKKEEEKNPEEKLPEVERVDTPEQPKKDIQKANEESPKEVNKKDDKEAEEEEIQKLYKELLALKDELKEVNK